MYVFRLSRLFEKKKKKKIFYFYVFVFNPMLKAKIRNSLVTAITDSI